MTTPRYTRRLFCSRVGVGALALMNRSSWGQESRGKSHLLWHDVRDWGVEGKGWTDTSKYFDRLPSRAQGKVPDKVWKLSRQSSGMLARFRTDASEIWVDYAVTSKTLATPHIPATAVSGVDLYAEEESGNWRWMSVTRPTSHAVHTRIADRILPGERGYAIYLPIYNGTEFLKIGVPDGASFEPIPPRKEKPLLFYGTSITHGACASRPGMPHAAILGRRLQRPILNFGFAGAGRMESSVGEFLCELDPAVYVLDCLPNMTAELVDERTIPLVKQLREARPETPIVLVEDRTYANASLLLAHGEHNESNRRALRDVYRRLQQEGTQKLFYIDGESLLGQDREDTTDGSHPSDLGFYRQANAFEPVLKKALEVSQ